MIETEKIEALTAEIDEIINGYLPGKTAETDKIAEAVSYSVKAGGKRIRPMIMREAYRTFAGDGKDPELLHAFMAAMEFIHTYSLVHDDLPAMDNDMYRRGKLSTHAAFGHAAAILAGDALLNLAFETALNAISEESDPVAVKNGLEALKVIAERSGISGMVGGQCLDVFSEESGTDLTEREILYIYHGKTSALLQASLMAGALLGGADPEYVRMMDEIGEYIGLAFQIRDDIFDYNDDPVIGKPTGNDMKEGKLTLPVIYVILNSGDDSVYNLALKVRSGDASDSDIQYLISYTKDNGGISYAQDIMTEYAEKAKSLLNVYPDSDVKQALCSYVDFVVGRKY